MRLIAKKPCQYGGKKFYIGDEIPAEFVAEPKKQERLGVLSIIKEGSPSEEAEATREAEALEYHEGTVTVRVPDERDEQIGIALRVNQQELQQVFDIMQLDAGDAADAIAQVESDNVLVLLHAADSRKTVKNAAKKQADNLYSTSDENNEANNGNGTTDAEGSDA